jgi:branched-chain amino acid transport system substrate-binding protein
MAARHGFIGATFAAAFLATPWLATPVAAQTIKIGVITSYSGFLAQAGDNMEKGFALYAKLHEKDLPPGVKIELIRRDDTSDKPDVGKRQAQELIARDRVQFLTGLVSSPVAAAIAPLTAEAKVPLVLMNAAGTAIPRISPYVVRVSFTLWQQSYPLGKWAAQQGWKNGYTGVSDYIPGHDAEGGFIKGFADGGGTNLKSVRFPQADPDFAPFMQRMKDTKPDFIFTFVPGGRQATAFIKNWADLGLRDAGIKVISTQDLVADDELPNMGDLPIGVVSAGSYSGAAKRPANVAFIAAFEKEYGPKVIPNYISVGGWDGMAAIFDVIKETKGKFDADQAMKILSNWKNPDSPRGPIEVDPATRDIVQNIYIRRLEKVDGKLGNVEFETIPKVKDPWKEFNPPK